ncbi:MAG TPA: beta-propeller fold lactonase family protein [Mucilaginibacter sp.]
MEQSQTFPQLSFAINNKDQANTIYITDDPTVNQLTFTINTNAENTKFTTGQLVPPDDAPSSTGSELYLDLSSLNISAEDFNKIVCTATDWQFERYANSIICMAPTADKTIAIAETISVSIANLVLKNPPEAPNVNLPVTYYRVTPPTLGNLPQVSFFKVLLQAAPDGTGDLHEAIDCVLTSTPYIVNTIDDYGQVDNNITIAFKPGTKPKTVKAGKDTTFTVSFVYAPHAPGYGALTTPTLAMDNIEVKQGENASAWSVTANVDADNPFWILQPPNKAPIIGTGVGAIVSFNINKIVTRFEPGSTLMYVQYQNVPGYNDGSYYIVLNKVPHVAITEFTATPNPSYLNPNGKTTVNLQWKTSNQGNGTLLLYPGIIDVTKVTSYQDTEVEDTTKYTLMAYGEYSSDKGNIATRSITATVLPKINSFVAQPQNSYVKNFPTIANLLWNVSSKNNVNLVSSVTGQNPFSFNPVGSVELSIKQPQMITLVPKGEVDPAMIKSIVLSAFKTTTTNYSLGDISVSVLAAMPSSGNIVFGANSDTGLVYAINTLTYQVVGSPVQVGSKPGSMVLSSDGQYLYVANAGSNSVSVLKIINTGGVFSISVIATVDNVGSRPASIAISPTNDFIYVAGNPEGTVDNTLTVIQKSETDTYSIISTVTVGKGKGSVAASPDGRYVFVANNAAANVSVIQCGTNRSFTPVKTITVGLGPLGIAVSPDNKSVFVCNNTAGTVSIISIRTLELTGTPLEVGKNPGAVVITPSSYYVFVANAGDSGVSLIALDNDTDKYMVAEKKIAIDYAPGSLALAPSGNQVFVAATTNSSSITSLNLVTYQVANEVIFNDVQPTNTVPSADNKKVLVWKSSSAPADNIGVKVVDTQTYLFSQAMAGLSIVDVVYTPDNKYIYVIQGKDNQVTLNLKDAATYVDVATISGLQGTPNRLCINKKGTELYVSLKDIGGGANGVAIIDTATKNITATVTLPKGSSASILPLTVMPDSSKIFVIQENIVSAIVYSNTGYKVDKNLTVGDVSQSIGILPDGSTVITVASKVHSISVIDTKTYAQKTIVIPSLYSNYLTGIAVSPDGANFVVSDTMGAKLLVIDTVTYNVNYTLKTGAFPEFPAYLSDGSQIFVPNRNYKSVSALAQIQPDSKQDL